MPRAHSNLNQWSPNIKFLMANAHMLESRVGDDMYDDQYWYRL